MKIKMSRYDYIHIGQIIALDFIAQKPFTNGFIAKKLRDKTLMRLNKQKQKIVKGFLKA